MPEARFKYWASWAASITVIKLVAISEPTQPAVEATFRTEAIFEFKTSATRVAAVAPESEVESRFPEVVERTSSPASLVEEKVA